jgi:uncharacterized membrane protein YidH (DUF202 family)
MDGSAGFVVAVFMLLITLAIPGGMFLVMDFRHFNEVVAQCERQGYIQNNTTRIICSKEK